MLYFGVCSNNNQITTNKNFSYINAMIQDIFPPVRVKISDLNRHLDGFVKSIAHKRKETVGTYERALREFIHFFATDRKFMFRVPDVERYRKHLITTKGMKETSVATYMTALRRLCQYLVEIGILEKNAAKRVYGGARPTQHNRTFLTLDEVATLLASIDLAEAVGLRDTAIIRIMIGCACSEVEMTTLNVGDLQAHGKGWVLLVQGKGKSIKDERVAVPDDTVRAVQTYIQSRTTLDKPTLAADEPMLLSYSNRSRLQRITVRGVREAILLRLTQSGVRQGRRGKLTPFSLRHTAGILMVESGATVEEVMTRMRIEWRPTAMLYFKQKGRLHSDEQLESRNLVKLHEEKHGEEQKISTVA
jgi:integrase/recombinase XerC